MLNRFFHLDQLQTSIKTECLAGFTSFLTMAYILLVNPAILGDAGIDKGAVFTATILATAIGTFLCGIFSNLPIAIAPALGLSTFFTFIVVQKVGFTWQEALGAVFIAGIIFLILTFFRIRQWVIDAIPQTLHMAIASGIGLFLAMVGLKEMHVFIIDAGKSISLGNILTPQVGLGFLGFFLMLIFDKFRVNAAILLSIFIITLLSVLLGYTHIQGFFALSPSLHPTFWQFNFDALARPNGIAVIFTFVLVALFDSTGTLIGLLHQAKLTDKKRISKALAAEGVATLLGSTVGTSTISPYIESAAGIASGGRSGLTACVISLLFLTTLFLAPLAQSVPTFACAPALLYVACKMLGNLAFIHWRNPVEFVPSLLTIILIPWTFSIANGIAFGFVIYIALLLLTGQWRRIQWSSSILFVVFITFLIVTRGQ